MVWAISEPCRLSGSRQYEARRASLLPWRFGISISEGHPSVSQSAGRQLEKQHRERPSERPKIANELAVRTRETPRTHQRCGLQTSSHVRQSVGPQNGVILWSVWCPRSRPPHPKASHACSCLASRRAVTSTPT
jgi:hypothetical protein